MMLRLKQISAGYGENTILRDVSLEFLPGTVTAIVGPNGCGKSTLLKAAAGLIPVSSGTVEAEAPRARTVAWLPQSRTVPEMTARQLVLHGRFPWLGWPRRYRREDLAIAEAALERLGVGEYAHRPLSELSGGTRQKVYLAMALAQEAKTLLLDEPTSFLDVGCQLEFLSLCRFLAEEGRAVVVVLHDLGLALSHADRVAVMEKGRLAALGPPAEVWRSGILDRVFGVEVLKLETPAGEQYVCVK